MLLHPAVIGKRKGGRFLLDKLSQAPSLAFSLRQVSSDYTGAILRVRRSSDNTTLDVGLVDGYLDTASLLSFVGAGSGFVTRWYDQMTPDGTRYMEQTTTANQPRIVNAGVLDASGSMAGVQGTGTGMRLALAGSTAYAPPTSGVSSIFVAYRAAGTNSNFMIAGTAADNGTANGLRQMNNGRMLAGTSGSPIMAVTAGNKYLQEGVYTFGTGIRAGGRQNGGALQQNLTGNFVAPMGAGTVLFARTGVNAEACLMFEAFWFDLDLTQGNRDKLEASVGNAYGITMA